MEDVLLGLPKIDYDRTAENVVEFLTNRSYYPRLYDICMQANPENLKSPSLSGMPGGSVGNSNEEKMVKYLYAKAIVDGVRQTIDKGSNELKVVFNNVTGEISSVEAMQMLHYEKTKYYLIRKRALNEFADILEVQNLHCPDLHIYIWALHKNGNQREFLKTYIENKRKKLNGKGGIIVLSKDNE